MIDLHCHIVPGIDDGPDTLEASLRMMRIAEEDGIKTIIATPHYYRGRFEAEAQRVKALIEELKLSAEKENIGVDIIQGNEVLLDREIIRLYKEGEISTLGDSRYLLIEFPFEGPPDYALDMIYELRLLGIVPIIAHPERYVSFIKKTSLLNEYIREGCLLQLNGGSLSGFFGGAVQRTSETLLRHGAISFIGSDAHTPRSRTPELKKSFDIIGKNYGKYKEKLINNVEKLAKNHEIVTSSEEIKVKRSIFGIFNR
jgi:protein-tyrosine phosphatase